MTSKTIPDMKEIFRQAAEIAQQVPESMQVAAFNRALDLLTGATNPVERQGAGTPMPSTSAQQSTLGERGNEKSPVEVLMSAIDTTQHPAIASTGKVLDRSLMVLQIALRNHDVDGLTPPEIAEILTNKFRLNTSRQAVSMAISSATNLVNRVPRGTGYEYRIMGPGEDYLTHIGSDREGAPANPSRQPPKPKAKRAAKQSDLVEPSKPRGGKSGRPGPKQMLETLIADQFFDAPRNISQIIEHVQHRYARTYKATDLSPTLVRLRRENKLDRSKNDKGIYEYVIHR